MYVMSVKIIVSKIENALWNQFICKGNVPIPLNVDEDRLNMLVVYSQCTCILMECNEYIVQYICTKSKTNYNYPCVPLCTLDFK